MDQMEVVLETVNRELDLHWLCRIICLVLSYSHHYPIVHSPPLPLESFWLETWRDGGMVPGPY